MASSIASTSTAASAMVTAVVSARSLVKERSIALPCCLGSAASRRRGCSRASGPSSSAQRRHFSQAVEQPQSQPPNSCHILLTSLPTNTCPNDVFRLLRQRTSVENTTNRLKDLASLHFIRTPSLYQTDDAIASFHIDASARRFQRAVDGVSLTGRHVRARMISADEAARRLKTSSSPSFSSQLIHLLVSQDSGSNVLLRGLPPTLHVSRLHDQLRSAYSLAPPTQIRHSKKTMHLRSVFDTSARVAVAARELLIRRKDELHRLMIKKRKVGLSGIMDELEAARYTAGEATGSDTEGQAILEKPDESGNVDEASLAALHSISTMPPAYKNVKGVEGPSLRLDSHSEDSGNPYSYTHPAKAWWDILWIQAQLGQPFFSRPAPASRKDGNSKVHRNFVPFLPIIKLPYPNMNANRAWFVVRMTDAADAHRLVRRWNNTYYSEQEFGQKHLVEAHILY
ncbi:hypothetical protein OC845_003540 [Tilletia horrida]|nr:hypothetical protein OC845_003540 [Tilletia horrida]